RTLTGTALPGPDAHADHGSLSSAFFSMSKKPCCQGLQTFRMKARVSASCASLSGRNGVVETDMCARTIRLHYKHRDRLVDDTLQRGAGKLGQHVVEQGWALARDNRLAEAVPIIHADDA